jgi:hypothetical protein
MVDESAARAAVAEVTFD